VPPIRPLPLVGVLLMSLLVACGTKFESDHRELMSDLQTQDRTLKQLREEIRLQRAIVRSSPADTSAQRRLDALLIREEDALRLRQDIKESADEKARDEYEGTSAIFRDDSRDRSRRP
jgi:hypothetical protein